jgi:hypothetical protein
MSQTGDLHAASSVPRPPPACRRPARTRASRCGTAAGRRSPAALTRPASASLSAPSATPTAPSPTTTQATDQASCGD